jgi:hypothetical protein
MQDQLDFLAGVTWTSADERTRAAFAATFGDEAADAAATEFHNRFMYSVVLSHECASGLKFVLQHDLGIQQNGAAGTPDSPDAQWYGVNSYMFYSLCDTVSVGSRAEWFRDDDGTRVTGIGHGNRIANGSFAGDFWGLTFGANWKPNPNVVVRPEIRFDWFDGPLGQLPYDAGDSSHQSTFAVDAILTY